LENKLFLREWHNMTDSALPSQRFVERDFSTGQVFNRTFSIMSRNLLPFGLIAAIASLPSALLLTPGVDLIPSDALGGAIAVVGVILMLVLSALSQAVVLYGAFDDMRNRPVNIAESIKVGLRRFFSVLGVAIFVPVLTTLAGVALIFPGFMVATMLFVSMPACVVEQLGPIKAMGRSARLTKGHRWKIFGIWFAILVVGAAFQSMLQNIGAGLGGPVGSVVVTLLWGAVYGAFSAILAVVAYHDLRVAKEGVDTDQIAAVFD
jgi:hypothetical protein